MTISADIHILTDADLEAALDNAFKQGVDSVRLGTTDEPVREALRLTLVGLEAMIPEQGYVAGHFGSSYLRFMVASVIGSIGVWPVDKTARWIGFIQAALYARGVLNIDAERARTRPFFHEAYAKSGQAVPITGEDFKPLDGFVREEPQILRPVNAPFPLPYDGPHHYIDADREPGQPVYGTLHYTDGGPQSGEEDLSRPAPEINEA